MGFILNSWEEGGDKHSKTGVQEVGAAVSIRQSLQLQNQSDGGTFYHFEGAMTTKTT